MRAIFGSEFLPDSHFLDLEFSVRTFHYLGKKCSALPFIGSIFMIHQGKSSWILLHKAVLKLGLAFADPALHKKCDSYFWIGDMHDINIFGCKI